MNLLEIVSPRCRVLTEDRGECRVAVKWQHAGRINENRRLYPKALLQREIARLSPLIREGKVSGCSYHPDNVKLSDISHLWESIKMEPDGSCTGIVRVIPTTCGKNVQALLRAGGYLGMSSRGSGSTTRREETVNGKKVVVEEVNDDFLLVSPGDFVLAPSVPDAGVIRLMESKLDGTWDEVREAILRQRYETAVRLAGYRGDYATYRQLIEKGK